MEDAAVSVSKGVFFFKNGPKSRFKRSKFSKNITTNNIFSKTPWFQSYTKMWNVIEGKLETLNYVMFSNLLKNLVDLIKNSYNEEISEIPTATLLTGINMPDHGAQFNALYREIKRSVSPHVAVLNSQDCPNLKALLESVVTQFVVNNEDINFDDEDSDSDLSSNKRKIRKNQCTFAFLQSWFEMMYGTFDSKFSTTDKRKTRSGDKLLVVIIPDFESFDEIVIQDFILLISSYLNILPFVLVFGVATSLNVLHKSLPYHVSSKISVQIFNSQPSTAYLNNVIEKVFFTEDCPFHLGGKVFNLLTDIFLFYDLSVKGFIKNFKFAMLEHFSYGNEMALCTNAKNFKKIIDTLRDEDLQNIQKLPSFVNFLKQQSLETNSKLTNLHEFKIFLNAQLQKFICCLHMFHLFLKCLFSLVHDLPKTPLGKQLRELYGLVLSKNISKSTEFTQCFQILSCLSKEELTTKTSHVVKLLEDDCNNNKINTDEVEEILNELEALLEEVEKASTSVMLQNEQNSDTISHDKSNMNRRQLQQKLLEMAKKSKPKSEYEEARINLIKYLEGLFEKYLKEPNSLVFYEIFFFNDLSIKNQIIGSHTSSVHAALNDPHHYLQCSCCTLENSEDRILSTMPDISILYKLHLEYGKIINLYDWFQSFLSIVDSKNAADDQIIKVKPEFQARFTQAVADLQYLGFIKTSKRNANHVTRLTWGG